MIENSQISATVVANVQRLADLAVIALAGLVSYYIRHGELALHTRNALVVISVTLISANVFHFFDLYNHRKLVEDPFQLRSLTVAFMTAALIILSIGYLMKISVEVSRIWMTLWAVGAFSLLLITRTYLKIRLMQWRAKGWLTKRIALVGAGDQGARLVAQLQNNPDTRISIVGVFDDRRTRVPERIGGFAVRGSVSDLLGVIAKERIDEVIVALPWTAESRVAEVLGKLGTAPIDVRLCPEGVGFRFANKSHTDMWGVAMLNTHERPLTSWLGVVKRIEDRVLAVIILIFVTPLMLGIALAIKLDSRGPVFFKQRRFGFSNELIEVYKFRTLYQDQTDWNDETQVTKHDSRVTRVGAFLRRSSLDELPQFFNVLKGDMSIVGPRPHATQTKAKGKLFEDVVQEYFARHRVKPGITGWAQVNGWRGETDTREKIERRVEYDLYYIDRWSLWFDLKIILMTPWAMLFAKNQG